MRGRRAARARAPPRPRRRRRRAGTRRTPRSSRCSPPRACSGGPGAAAPRSHRGRRSTGFIRDGGAGRGRARPTAATVPAGAVGRQRGGHLGRRGRGARRDAPCRSCRAAGSSSSPQPLPPVVRHKVYTAEYVADVAIDDAGLRAAPSSRGPAAGPCSSARAGSGSGFDRTVLARGGPAARGPGDRPVPRPRRRVAAAHATSGSGRTARTISRSSAGSAGAGADPRLRPRGRRDRARRRRPAHLLAQLLTGRPTDLDLAPFRPDRFAAPPEAARARASSFDFDGRALPVEEGQTVAAALWAAGVARGGRPGRAARRGACSAGSACASTAWWRWTAARPAGLSRAGRGRRRGPHPGRSGPCRPDACDVAVVGAGPAGARRGGDRRPRPAPASPSSTPSRGRAGSTGGTAPAGDDGGGEVTSTPASGGTCRGAWRGARVGPARAPARTRVWRLDVAAAPGRADVRAGARSVLQRPAPGGGRLALVVSPRGRARDRRPRPRAAVPGLGPARGPHGRCRPGAAQGARRGRGGSSVVVAGHRPVPAARRGGSRRGRACAWPRSTRPATAAAGRAAGGPPRAPRARSRTAPATAPCSHGTAFRCTCARPWSAPTAPTASRG